MGRHFPPASNLDYFSVFVGLHSGVPDIEPGLLGLEPFEQSRFQAVEIAPREGDG